MDGDIIISWKTVLDTWEETVEQRGNCWSLWSLHYYVLHFVYSTLLRDFFFKIKLKKSSSFCVLKTNF